MKSESTPSTPPDAVDAEGPSLVRRAARRVGARARLAFYLLAGVIGPIICFACAAPSGNWAADRPWQAGQFWVYATLMLKWPAVAPFYPLLLFSMAAMALFACDRQRFMHRFAVRLGIFGGVPMALLFCWLVYVPSDVFDKPANIAEVMLVIAVILGAAAVMTAVLILLAWAIWTAYRALRRDAGAHRLVVFIAAVIGVAALAILLGAGDPNSFLVRALEFPATFIVVLGPAWAALAYSLATIEILYSKGVSRRWNLKHVFGLTAWVAGLFGAWRSSMSMAIAEYATLPVEDPNCFVCSAAARGHQRVVHGESIPMEDGRVLRVNGQMRTLKALELAMKAVAPRAHRMVRAIYDRIGPPLARRLSNPWAADAAYLALKPAELLARALLRAIFHITGKEIGSLYREGARRRPDGAATLRLTAANRRRR